MIFEIVLHQLAKLRVGARESVYDPGGDREVPYRSPRVRLIQIPIPDDVDFDSMRAPLVSEAEHATLGGACRAAEPSARCPPAALQGAGPSRWRRRPHSSRCRNAGAGATRPTAPCREP